MFVDYISQHKDAIPCGWLLTHKFSAGAVGVTLVARVCILLTCCPIYFTRDLEKIHA